MLVSFHQEVACLDNISLWMLSFPSVFLLWYSYIRLDYISFFSFLFSRDNSGVTYMYICIINVKTHSAF
jgi:hypothetical protein